MLTGRKLLLADDSLTIQKVVSLTFNDERMEVTTVGSGAEALEKLDESLPDIVLADVFMPEPNGYELCERIKRDERTRHIPVLLLVGTFESFNEAEARRVGADEVLTKPFQSIRDLVNKVGGLLGNPEEKDTHADQVHDERRSDEEATQGDSSSFAADTARAADLSAAVTPATTPANAFGDFDMDDATIQTTPATAFDAQHSNAFPEISEVEQFSDRGRTDEAFDLGDDSPVPAHAATAAADTPATSSEVSPVAGSAFAAHAARAAEADDALLELGDSTPMREASDEADDFILDIDDGDAFGAPAAHERAGAADDIFFTESAATVGTEERKFFAEPDVSESPAPIAETAPRMLAQEMETAAPEEAPLLLREESFADASGFELENAPAAAAAATESEFSLPEAASSFETVTTFESQSAPVFETSSESNLMDEVQANAPAVAAVASEQSHPGASSSTLSPEIMDELVRRVVAQMSEQVVREIAWEVVPDLAERLIKQRLEEEKTRPTP